MINPGAWSKVVAPLRERDFRLLWAGNLVSLLGDGIFTVALALEALRVDHQPTGLAFVLAARTVPSVALSILGGVVVDRLPRRTAMLASDVCRGLAVGAIAVLVISGDASLLALILMAVIFGVADAFSGPASLAVIPELLPVELVTQANALNSTSSQLSFNLVGPAIGGIAVAAVGTAAAFAFDALSFAVSAACVTALRLRRRPERSGKSLLAEAGEGIHYIVSRRWLFFLLIGAAASNLVGMGPFAVLLPVFVRHVLHSSALVLGLVYASAGAAGVIGSLIVARLGSPRHLLEMMWFAYGTSGLLVAAIFFAPNAWVTAILSAGSAGLVVYGDVLYFTRLQTSVPQHLLGRVSSVSYVLVMTLTPLGTLAGGVAAALVGARVAFLVSGLLAGACALVLLLPGARTITPEPLTG